MRSRANQAIKYKRKVFLTKSAVVTGTDTEKGRTEMDNSKKLKIGVIGCGAISVRRHLPEYAENENV